VKYSRLEDGELVRRILAGETGLFEIVMHRYSERLFNVARAVLSSGGEEAEDVLQEAFVRAYEHLSELRDPTRLGPWLTQIVMHESKARARKRRTAVLMEVPVRALASSPRDPEQEALARQLQGVLAAAVDELPVAYRTVFVLRDLQGLSTLEVAESLGMSPAAVKVRLFRARAALRNALWEMVGTVLAPFKFAGARCDRLVKRVLHQLRARSGHVALRADSEVRQ
jgi:RNA polymerase sigma-70 factor, ECF subfamily